MLVSTRGRKAHTSSAREASSLPGVRLAGGRYAPVWRAGPHRIWWRNGWRTFVPLTALAVLAVGPRHYYPYAYIAAPRPYCEGYTEDGCLLDWREVETLEGDILAQCVAYCPWQEY
jgi:hypothetical protein